MDSNESAASVSREASCCLSSASRRLQWGCMSVPSSRSRVHSHIALTTCKHVCVCVCLLLPYKKPKIARSTSVSTSFLLSFLKGCDLQSWRVFHRLSGFKLCCSCSRGLPQLKYFYCRSASLENCCLRFFHAGLERIRTLQEYLLSKSEAFTEGPAVQL